MSTTTTNLKLNKPAMTDLVSTTITQLGSNFDILDSQLADIASSIVNFPLQIPEVDDTPRFGRALSSGKNIILEQGKTYTVNNASISASNFILFGNNAKLQTSIKDDSCLVFGSTVQNVKIQDLSFSGSADNTCSNAAGISLPPNGSNYTKGNGIQNIEIEKCQFLGGFVFSIAGSGVTKIDIHHCYFTGNYYNPTVSAGGYCILMQACYEVDIYKNKFVATAHDRHAVYISEVPTGGTTNNSCQDVKVRDSIFDWTGVSAMTGFETCLMCRSVQTMRIENNDFWGGYGGNDFSPSKGNINDLFIINNRYYNQISDQNHSRAAVTLGHDAYAYKNVTIKDNHVKSANNQVDAFDLNDFTNLILKDNMVDLNGNGAAVYLLNGNTAEVSGNELNGNGLGTAGLQFYGTGANYTIGRNAITGFASREKFYSSVSQLSNMIHDYYRYAQIETTGTGTITVKSDLYNLISSIVSQPYGCDITFNPQFLVSNDVSINLTTYFGIIGAWGIRSIDTTNNIVSLNLYNTSFASMPLATNQLGIYLKTFA